MNKEPSLNDIYFIDPEEVYKSINYYSNIIARILKGCYGEDYPGTSIEPDNNLKNLSNKTQCSALWAITEEEFEHEQFGTLSIIDASAEFGENFGEMGKSGSLGEKFAKLGYIKFFQEWENKNKFLEKFEFLVATIRNCPERPGKTDIIKSGIGVRIILLKYLQFQQWGVAPWLLMPDETDGSYEVLDLIFQFRNIDNQIQYLAENKIVLIGEQNQNLLKNFVQFNLNIDIEFNEISKNQNYNQNALKGWTIIKPQDRINKNAIKLVPSINNIEFKDAYNNLNKNEGAMHSIYLPLTIESVQIQELLESEGWTLTGFIPGTINDNKTNHLKGMWSKLKTNRPFAEANYIKHPDELSPNWYYQFVTKTMLQLSELQNT